MSKKQKNTQNKTTEKKQNPAPAPKNIGQRIWDFFASVKLSFALFLTLALGSVAGTLLPQKEAAGVYIRQFGETGGNLILKLGLNDAYHAYWFLLLLGLLAANLVICSVERLPNVWKIVSKDPEGELKRKRQAAESFTMGGSAEKIKPAAEAALKKALGQVYANSSADSSVLFAQKGAWSRFGVYVVHLSVLVIFAGAMVGGIWGYKGYMNIPEGQAVDHIELETGGVRHLGFALRLDKFSLTKYEGKNIPSEYRSDVTFLDKAGKEIKKASLIVNDPAEHNNIVFYQSSYGTSPSNLKMHMERDGKHLEVDLKQRAWTELPGGGRAGVMEVRDRVNMGQMYSGPIVRVLYEDEKNKQHMITAFGKGAKVPSRGPVKFEIVDITTVPYTGLQVKYDPGVWFIWVGCTLMVIGFIIAFYLSHRKVWMRLTPASSGRTRVEIAGSTNKNRPGLQRLMLRLAAEIKEQE